MSPTSKRFENRLAAAMPSVTVLAYISGILTCSERLKLKLGLFVNFRRVLVLFRIVVWIPFSSPIFSSNTKGLINFIGLRSILDELEFTELEKLLEPLAKRR